MIAASLPFLPPGGPAFPGHQHARAPAATRRRARLWDLHPSIHCSVVGTCLTTAELRRAMNKALDADLAAYGDHDLHATAVGLCTNSNTAAAILNKALDRRHDTAIRKRARIRGEPAVMLAWADSRQRGDIPGAYWAVLTHPDIGPDGIRRAFGDVHMLSHLVGAANRADIRRLTALEDENARLQAKVERQQLRISQAAAEREDLIRGLAATPPPATPQPPGADPAPALHRLVDDLRARLADETARRARAETRATRAGHDTRAAAARAEAAEAQAAALRTELAALEHLPTSGAPPAIPACRILYVGGFPGVVARLRALLEAAGATLLAHDGGRHDAPSLLPGLVAQADTVAFPVDCVSHDAVIAIKRHCRQRGTPYLPLRSAGIGSFLAAIAAAPPTLPNEVPQ